MRPGFGPAAELPASSPASRRHGSCRSRLGSTNVIRGNRRAALASARGTGRTAYTKDVRPTQRERRDRLNFRLMGIDLVWLDTTGKQRDVVPDPSSALSAA